MSAGLRTFKRIEAQRPGDMARRPATTTVIWILFLLIPIVLDVTLWATLYYASGALPSFEEALYFSTVTFTTVGSAGLGAKTCASSIQTNDVALSEISPVIPFQLIPSESETP